jgi:hypothetical protein
MPFALNAGDKMARSRNRLTVVNVSEPVWDVIEFVTDRLNEGGGTFSEADVARWLLSLGAEQYRKTGKLGGIHLPYPNTQRKGRNAREGTDTRDRSAG